MKELLNNKTNTKHSYISWRQRVQKEKLLVSRARNKQHIMPVLCWYIDILLSLLECYIEIAILSLEVLLQKLGSEISRLARTTSSKEKLYRGYQNTKLDW